MREAHPDDDQMEYVMATKNPLRVLVKISTIDEDGNEEDILRQFEVLAKLRVTVKSESGLALRIMQIVESSYNVENVEAWTV
jgi:hypothetical protein